MKVPLLDLRAQYAAVHEDVDRAVREVIEAQRFILGPAVEQLEMELGSYIGVEHAIGCASGTDAILLALRGLELRPGDEVVVPAFTFFATAGAVWNAGLKPVFCDVDPATYNVTADLVAAALTERTRAVVVVHLFGQMAEMGPLLELAQARGIALIEDAAQSIGARQLTSAGDAAAGALGVAGCFSFFPSKNLGGFGDGGLISTNDADLAERLRKLRVHGGRQMYHHEMVGTNSRLDALQAAVLSAKLPYLEGWSDARRENARHYDERLRGIGDLTLPVTAAGNTHVFNQYTIRTAHRDALQQHLAASGVGTGIYYPVPLHLQECFASLGYIRGSLPESERAAEEVLSLPIYPELAPAELEHVSATITAFFNS